MKEGWNDSFGVRRKSTKVKSPDSELITLNCCADKINEYFCSPKYIFNALDAIHFTTAFILLYRMVCAVDHP